MLYLKINICESRDDYTLSPIDQLIKSDGNAFKQYGAFYKNAIGNFTPTKPSKLPNNTKFGHGTVYEQKVYHQFEIRKLEQHDSFIKKCKLVLEEL